MQLAITVSVLSMMLAGSGSADPHFLQGAGTVTCGKFAADYQKSPEVFEDTYFTWAQGFMSATNAHLVSVDNSSQMRDLNGWSHERQLRYIRDYCDKHPLQMYIEAVRGLFWSLPTIPQSSQHYLCRERSVPEAASKPTKTGQKTGFFRFCVRFPSVFNRDWNPPSPRVLIDLRPPWKADSGDVTRCTLAVLWRGTARGGANDEIAIATFCHSAAAARMPGR